MSKLQFLICFIIFSIRSVSAQPQNWIVTHQHWDSKDFYWLKKDSIQKIVLDNISGKERTINYWLHTRDIFTGYEAIAKYKDKPGTLYSNVILLDTNGEVSETIYESKPYQYVSDAFPSGNDKYLVFYTWEKDTIRNAGFLQETFTIRIVELESKKLVKSIPTHFDFWNFELEDNPWSPNEKEFVYTISNDINVSKIGQPHVAKLRKDDGIYLYNLDNDTHTRILNEGRYAVWSSDGKYIAYLIGEKEARVYDIATKKSKKVFAVKGNARINKMFWVPQTNTIYFGTIRNRFKSRYLVKEESILMDAHTKKRLPLPNIKFDMFFTWK